MPLLKRAFCLFVVTIVLVASFAVQANAGTITSAQMFGLNAGTGPGLGTLSIPAIFTPNPANDNQIGGGPTDNNITVPIKRFDHPDYIDIVFNVVNDGGITEYKFFEAVDNNTFYAPNNPITWSNYQMVLGFNTGVNFTQSPNGDGLDFDAPFYDTTPITGPAIPSFLSVATAEDSLFFYNGSHGTGVINYQFRIDVPDGISTFTLRQIPIVPEPASIGFVMLSLVGFGAWYRSRRTA